MATKEEKFIADISTQLDKLFSLYPIEDLRPSETNEEMKAGLARLYSDLGQRTYLENAVKIAIKNLSTSQTPVEIAFWKGRVETLEQLLAKGKTMYTNMAVLKKGKIQDATH